MRRNWAGRAGWAVWAVFVRYLYRLVDWKLAFSPSLFCKL